jgi:TonB family protein
VFDLLEPIGRWSLANLWLPLGAWTLVAALALAADAWLPLRRPRLRAALLTVVLAALPVGLLLRAAPLPLLWPAPAPAPTALPSVVALPSLPAAPPALVLPASAPAEPVWPVVLGVCVLLAALAAAIGFARLGVMAVRLHVWRRRLTDSPDACRAATHELREAGGGTAVRVVREAVTPCTVGLWRPVVILPHALDPSERRMALHHELAHVRHRDAAGHTLGLLARALLPWHPVAHLLSRRAELRREQAADAATLRFAPAAAYGRLLARFSGLDVPAPGLAFSQPPLTHRLAAMTAPLLLAPAGRLLPLATLTLLAAALALPLRAQDAPPRLLDDASEFGQPQVVGVIEGTPQLLPSTDAALRTLEQTLTFPSEARRLGWEGEIRIRATVDADGRVVSTGIAGSGFRVNADRRTAPMPNWPSHPDSLQASIDSGLVDSVQAQSDAASNAMQTHFGEAIRQLRFEPAVRGGVPVEADVLIPISFSFADGLQAHPPVFMHYASAADEPADVHLMVDQMPRFLPDEETALRQMQAAIRYPALARRANVQGHVTVQFVVDEKGRVTDPVVVRGAGAGLDEEALRVIQTLRFEPGRQEGRAVKVQMSIQVVFSLERADQTPERSQPRGNHDNRDGA